jgi:glycine/D-amino acid oxidase-like deaminating enzyme
MAKSAEVIVVGSGIAGSSTAFHVVSHGVGVTLVEKGFPTGGPSRSAVAGRSTATTWELSSPAGCRE